MALGFSQLITGAKLLSEVMSDNKDQAGTVSGGEKFQRSQAIRVAFENLKRPSKALQEAGQVKASEAISYQELNKIWDSILPNAYAEIIRTQEQPAYSPKKEII
tara:strand:+ start:542 stop:853 length:312 start_codon:yes stop_codon:yes gene_type:complete